jgi:hypothetical protein
MVGKIFLAEIYFTDMADYKKRPILLFYKYRDEDFLFLPLTTNLSLPGIVISSGDLSTGFLQKPSAVIVPKISIIHESLLIKEIGELKPEKFAQIMKNVCEGLACQSYTKPADQVGPPPVENSSSASPT